MNTIYISEWSKSIKKSIESNILFQIDKTTGWLGARHEQSMHGSCPVQEGVKWAANVWINLTLDPEFDMTDVVGGMMLNK